MKKFFLILMFIISILLNFDFVYAHPGRTDSNGCHTCGTNCSKWGLYDGEYHCHNGSSSSSSSSSNNSSTSKVYGCTDTKAINYNVSATSSDGSCKYEKEQITTEIISYETIIKGNTSWENSRVVQKGINGEKQIRIKKIIDQKGNELSAEIISEEVIIEPVNEIIEYVQPLKTYDVKNITIQQSYENNPSFIFIVLGILLGINVFYSRRNEKSFMLLNEIRYKETKYKIVFYIMYFIFVIPIIIDCILAIIDWFKSKNKKR